jgi:hypothetical protein
MGFCVLLELRRDSPGMSRFESSEIASLRGVYEGNLCLSAGLMGDTDAEPESEP